VIPPHDTVTRALPPGRYQTTLVEIQDRFVTHDDFAESTSRVRNWAGLSRYVRAWSVAEAAVNEKLLLGFWIAGSFVTLKPDPSDIDVTPIYDLERLKGLIGKPGIGHVKKLLGDRRSIVREFHVEAFPLAWTSTGSSLFPEKLPAEEQQYLLSAGGLADWWQRFTRASEDGGPVHAKSYAEKGFLEVIM
jgi:hypothetical protein